eukprot:gb/GECG01011917.1/.p1 GENE.gb/GECG01011917.1/~~gb/GECG01011917.1/.p1  ORF type:complete len:138 (+),score=9.66 gb/GECG01011917.1/:1-414(+)
MHVSVPCSTTSSHKEGRDAANKSWSFRSLLFLSPEYCNLLGSHGGCPSSSGNDTSLSKILVTQYTVLHIKKQKRSDQENNVLHTIRNLQYRKRDGVMWALHRLIFEFTDSLGELEKMNPRYKVRGIPARVQKPKLFS